MRGSKKEKTVTRSFRINEEAFQALEKEARRQNISVNTIVNQQFVSFANFDRFVKKLGMIKISSATFQRLLDAASESDIAHAGLLAGSDTPKAIILSKEGSMNLVNVIDYLQMLSEYANVFEYSEVENGSKRVVTLLHRLGERGSVFFSNYVKGLFESASISPKIYSSEHSVVLEIEYQDQINA